MWIFWMKDLGITKISKSLSELTKSEKKSQVMILGLNISVILLCHVFAIKFSLYLQCLMLPTFLCLQSFCPNFVFFILFAETICFKTKIRENF